MRRGMGIAIRILKRSAVNGQRYSIAGGQGYSNSLGSVVRIRPADSTRAASASETGSPDGDHALDGVREW